MALPVHGACRHDQEEPSPEILYIEPQKKWLAHVEQAKLLSSRLGTSDYFVITFVDILPPLRSRVVLIGYVAKLAS